MISARSLGLEVAKVSAGEEIVRCPFHQDKTPSAWWNPSKELFYCAVCQLGLSCSQMMMRLNIEPDELEEVRFQPQEYDLFTEPVFIPKGDWGWNPYYQERGINPAVANTYQLEWMNGKPSGAILPITNVISRRVGAMVRYENPKEAGTRYKIFGETTPVWPMHLLPLCKTWIVVTEGVWSAMRLTGFWDKVGRNALALMGAKGNQRIVETMRPFNTIYLYDKDQAGQNACQKMRQLGVEHAYTLPVAPDDMNEVQLAELTERIDRICI